MTSTKKETKVLPFKEKSSASESKEDKLKRLQEMIDQGTYDYSADFIAKAYLHNVDKTEALEGNKEEVSAIKNTSHNSHTMKKKQ